MSRYKAYAEYKDSRSKWLGAIPTHWNLFDGKRLFSSRRESALESDGQLAASQKYGVIPQSVMMDLNDAKVMLALKGTGSFRHVNENDFVISLRSFEGGIEHSSHLGCVSPAYTVLRAEKTISPSYFKYLLKSAPYIAALQASTDSLRDGKSISYEQFGAIPLPYPTAEEQSAVSKFLDHETAKIDALIEKQQRLIELLKEKRSAVISHAVTKGLDPKAPMKDSGVEWLGEVPAHWEVMRLKHLAANIKAGPFGSAITKGMYVFAGYRVYGQEQVIPEDFSLGDYYISPETFLELSQYEVASGDILISCVGTFGKIAVVPPWIEPGIINPRLIRFRCNEHVIPSLLTIILRSAVVFEQFAYLSRGGTMDVINIGTLSEINVVVPPQDEQAELVERVNSDSARFAALTKEAETATALLKERRTALISAAVTGKIDVRDWQAAA